jgi:hypothetical protein
LVSTLLALSCAGVPAVPPPAAQPLVSIETPTAAEDDARIAAAEGCRPLAPGFCSTISSRRSRP